MSKLTGFTKRITAMLLSAILVIGLASGSVFGASTDGDLGQTSEVVVEDISSEEDVNEEPMNAAAEEPVQYYTVTLDANGGYFENEWDDAIGDYIIQAEVVEKHIPIDGTVAAFPVFIDQDGQTKLFAGWSLERDGELVSQAQKEYAPLDNCVLYAVWQTEDAALGETKSQEFAEEITEQTDPAKGSTEVDAAVEDTVTVEEETQPELNESSQEEETVREDAALADVGTDIIASGDCGDDAVWTLDSNHVLRISGSGEMYDYNSFNNNNYYPSWKSYKDDIYSVIIGEGITSVGREAFWNYDMISDISLPESLDRIGFLAFSGCNELTEVYLPDSLSVIDGSAFSECTKLVSINIPSGIVTIGNYAFNCCEKLNIDLIFPNCITEIGEGAFGGCKNINHIEIPESITELSDGVFSGCGITEIDIPENITAIGRGAFAVTKLQQIIIPDSVETLGDITFEACKELERIVFGKKIKRIPERCCSHCEKLNSIVLPEELQTISDGAFAGCPPLGTIDLPYGTTAIGYCAFQGSGVWCLNVPESVTKIGAFNDAKYLLYFGLPKKWEKVENYGEFSNVIFVDKRVESVSTLKNQYTVGVGNTLRVETDIKPADASCKKIRWNVENPEIAEVKNWYTDDEYCTIYGKKVGSTMLHGYSVDGEYEIACTINVVTYGVNGISLSCADSMILGINREKKISAKVTPEYAANKNIIWSSSDESVMTVNNEGIITGIGEGTATLTAISEDGRFQATSEVTTYIPVDSLSLSQKEITLYKGRLVTINAETSPENAEYNELTWNTSNIRVASFKDKIVTEYKGNSCTIYARGGGVATISVTTADNELTEYCKVHVISPLKSLALYNNNVKLKKGSEMRLVVNYNPSDTTERDVVWSSSDDEVVSVNKYGVITANNPGTATITVTSADTKKTATCIVTVFIPVEHVVLDQENLTLAKGSEKKIQATVSPSNATDKNIEWRSSDENIATVNQDGVVTAVGQGKAIITATSVDGGISSSCDVTVFIPVEHVVLDQENLTLAKGSEKKIQATVSPSNATDRNIEWRSSDENIATVNQDGVVTAIGPGIAIITATSVDGGISSSCDVTVFIPVEGIILNRNEVVIVEGKTESLSAIIQPVDATDKSIEWSSSDNEIVRVDWDGLITAIAPGKAVITATSSEGDHKASCEVEVLTAIKGISLNQKELSLPEGKSIEIIAYIEPEDAYDKTVIWASSDDSIVAVDQNGIITAKKAGNAEISAYTADRVFVDKCTVSVVVPVQEIKLDSHEVTLTRREEKTLHAEVIPENASDKNVKWESTDDSIVEVDSNGTVKAKNIGKATVNAISNDGGLIDSCKISVVCSIDNAFVSEIDDQQYTGNPITPKPNVIFDDFGNSINLIEDIDYEIVYTDNIEVGKASLKISGKGNYIGDIICPFEIQPADISNANVTDIYERTYTGEYICQSPLVNMNSIELVSNRDYSISYEKNRDAGEALLIFSGKGNYTGIKTVTFKINPATISDSDVTGLSEKIYTGKALTQSPVVKIGSTTLDVDTDYTVAYNNNTNVGTATVIITGKGNYTGTKTATFTINKADQSITAKTSTSSIAVGKTATVAVTGNKGKVTYMSSDVNIATVNASTGVVTGKKAGTVTITATAAATANYNAASKTIKITVNKVLKKPGNCHFAKWNNAKFTNCQIAWNKVDGADGYQTLLSWTDGSHASSTYTKSNVLYRNCTVHPQHVSQMKVRAYYTLNGQQKFGPWSNVEYITPSPTTLTAKNASVGSNLKMNVSWNIIYGCNGYNVFITTNPNGKWYWYQSTAQNATSRSSVITKCGGAKLKKNTRYYVRIVTRRKRNGVFCTVPMPSNNAYTGTFIIK